MDTESQELGEVGMDEVIQSDSEVVSAPAEETDSGAESASVDVSGSTADTAPVDQKMTASVDQEVTTFYNATDVPEELRPTFKEMQKAFTQKTQKLASEVKQAESAQYHAKLFRELMGDQRVVAYLEELENTGGGVGTQAEGLPVRGYSSEDSEVDPHVAELRRTVQKLQGEVNRTRQRQDINAEKAAFVTAHPDWKKFEGGMDEAWKRVPQRSYEDAYNWAFRQSYLTKKGQLERQRSRAQAGVERPGPVADTKKTHKVDSFQDAVRASLDELGMSREEFGV